MNTSERLKPRPNVIDDSRFSFEHLHLREDDLREIRMGLYHSSGDGYHVFRGFVAPDLVAHMRTSWTCTERPLGYQIYNGNQDFHVGCPNYFVRYDDGSDVFYNFLYAPPLDEVTCAVSISVNMLRNRLSGRNAFEGIYGRYALQYRVTRNLNRVKWAAPHTDWFDYEKRWEKGQYDPSRLQATLFLSEKGVDYSGTGFRFSNNSGQSLVFGDDVPVAAGDLVIWRYSNLHSIEDVSTKPGQLGFLRIIYPLYTLPAASAQASLGLKIARKGADFAIRAARKVRRAVR